MNIFKIILGTTFLFSAINANAENKFQILDRGLDGDQRQFLVTCTDGTISSVTKYFELPEVPEVENKNESEQPTLDYVPPLKLTKVCIGLDNGDELCRPTWELENAAKTSCSQ